MLLQSAVLVLAACSNQEWSTRQLEERATALARFAEAVGETELFDEPGGLLDSEHLEIVVCRPRGVAFIHVFKAAGTTGMRLLEMVCPAPLDQYIHWPCVNEASRHPGWRCHEKPHDKQRVWANVSVAFTFVRDPLERFQSSLFEVCLRDQTHHHGYLEPRVERAKSRGTTVAGVVLDELIEARSKGHRINQHFFAQTLFITDNGRPIPQLKYVAMLGPNFNAEIAALTRAVFGVDVASLQFEQQHLRSWRDAAYARDVHVDFIRQERLDPATRLKALQYYAIDYAWLGGLRREESTRR